MKALGGVSGAGNWDIAVRSGGHSDYDNDAVGRGVTIDLSLFNDIKVKGNFSAHWNGTSAISKVGNKMTPWSP